MGKSKFGRYIFLGALVGGAVSMFDRTTRDEVARKTKGISSEIRFYSKNPEILKHKLQEKKVQLQNVYDQFSGDALYIKDQVEELKTLTPQVKELVVNTKDAFVESKDEYKSIVKDTPSPDEITIKK